MAVRVELSLMRVKCSDLKADTRLEGWDEIGMVLIQSDAVAVVNFCKI